MLYRQSLHTFLRLSRPFPHFFLLNKYGGGIERQLSRRGKAKWCWIFYEQVENIEKKKEKKQKGTFWKEKKNISPFSEIHHCALAREMLTTCRETYMDPPDRPVVTAGCDFHIYMSNMSQTAGVAEWIIYWPTRPRPSKWSLFSHVVSVRLSVKQKHSTTQMGSSGSF